MQRTIRAQAIYYIASGLTPMLSMKLFESITGKKTDRWLVRMVGLLAASIGASLWLATDRAEVDRSAIGLSLASALSFAGIDVVYSARGTISPIYLLDAAVEAGFMVRVLSELGTC